MNLTIIIPTKNEEGYISNILYDLTKQSEIGGVKVIIADANSTDKTIGWGAIYLDWDMDGIVDLATDTPPNFYVDPMRFKLNN